MMLEEQQGSGKITKMKELEAPTLKEEPVSRQIWIFIINDATVSKEHFAIPKEILLCRVYIINNIRISVK